MKQKLCSRKFWLCTAAFLGSLATSFSGLQSGNDAIACTGLICGAISAAIYAAAEATVDINRE